MVFFFFYLFDVLLKIQRKTETKQQPSVPNSQKIVREEQKKTQRKTDIKKSYKKRDLSSRGSRPLPDCRRQSLPSPEQKETDRIFLLNFYMF